MLIWNEKGIVFCCLHELMLIVANDFVLHVIIDAMYV